MNNTLSNGYKKYPYLKYRKGVWREIVRFVKKDAGTVNTLIELGAGYCDFINQFPAGRRIAYDLNPEMHKYADTGVDLRIEEARGINRLGDSIADLVFASNFMEHLDHAELDKLLPNIHSVLRSKGKLILLQPNYRLYPDRYFDDKTHKTIFSDENISGFLEKYGFSVRKLIPGLLPFSMKSRLPKWSVLVRLYLLSPIKPMAGQMYVVAERS